MIVYDFNVMRVAVAPAKADAPLVVDPDAVLPLAVAGKRLEPVARWSTQVVEACALWSWVSFRLATLMMSFGTPLRKRRCHAASAASFRNDLIMFNDTVTR